jgi:hypothetical protein
VKRHHLFVLILALNVCASVLAQSTFWTTSATPAIAASNDSKRVTLGLRFTADVSGNVTGVRFYKGKGNTGTHTGHLWSASGAKLASVTFRNESTTGWQTANFTTPVTIAANMTYVVSYTAPRGRYAINENFAWSSTAKPPLRVSGISPGVYSYGSGSRFPSSSWNARNYWVDVVFVPEGQAPSPPVTYTISGTVQGSEATLVLSGPTNATTATDALGQYTFSGLSNGIYTVSPSMTGYSFSPASATVTVSSASVSGIGFTGTAIPPPPPVVSLNWGSSPSAGVFGYNLYRATSSSGPYARLNSSVVAGTSFTDENVSLGQTYYYVATAVDSQGIESTYSNEASAQIAGDGQTPLPPPPPPVTYTISGTVQGSGATLSLSGPNAGTTTTDTQGKFAFAGLENGLYVVSPSATGYTFSPTSLAVTVASASVSGVNFSGTALPPPPPVVSLNWGASPSVGVVGYNLYRATSSSGPFARITPSPVTGTSYADESVSRGLTYFYVATAIDGQGMESIYSNQASAQTY